MILDFLAIVSNGAFPTAAITDKTNRALLAVSQGLLYEFSAPLFPFLTGKIFTKQKICKTFVNQEINKIFTKKKITKIFVR